MRNYPVNPAGNDEKETIGGFMTKRSVFVLGDSISIHYGPYLRIFLGTVLFMTGNGAFIML